MQLYNCAVLRYFIYFPVSSTALSAAQWAIQIHSRTRKLTTVPPLFAKPVTRMLDIEWVSNSGHSLGAHCRTTFPSSSSPPSAIFSSLGGSSPSSPWMGHCVRILSGRKLPQCCLNARDIDENFRYKQKPNFNSVQLRILPSSCVWCATNRTIPRGCVRSHTMREWRWKDTNTRGKCFPSTNIRLGYTNLIKYWVSCMNRLGCHQKLLPRYAPCKGGHSHSRHSRHSHTCDRSSRSQSQGVNLCAVKRSRAMQSRNQMMVKIFWPQSQLLRLWCLSEWLPLAIQCSCVKDCVYCLSLQWTAPSVRQHWVAKYKLRSSFPSTLEEVSNWVSPFCWAAN